MFIFPWCRETWAELVHWVGSVVPGFFSSVGREQCPREPPPGPHFRWGWGYEKCSWHNPPRGIHYGRGHFSRGRCSHTPSVAGGAGGLREKCPMHNPSPSCNPPLFHDLGAGLCHAPVRMKIWGPVGGVWLGVLWTLGAQLSDHLCRERSITLAAFAGRPDGSCVLFEASNPLFSHLSQKRNARLI